MIEAIINMNKNTFCFLLVCHGLFGAASLHLLAQENPFLPPGARTARPPQPVVRPAAPAPPPKPVNPNLELRGFFRYRDVWHFSVHDKVKNKGFWVTEGEGLSEAGIEVESFDDENEVLKLKGGMTLALKESANKTLPVPGQGKPKPISKKPTASKSPPKPPARRVTLPSRGGVKRTVTIPPRLPNTTARPGTGTTTGGRVRVGGKP